jgi:hypothetical protein
MSQWICRKCKKAIWLGKKGWFHYDAVDCKAEPDCEHDCPMDAENKCSLCGAQFIYCHGCSDGCGPVWHEEPECRSSVAMREQAK